MDLMHSKPTESQTQSYRIQESRRKWVNHETVGSGGVCGNMADVSCCKMVGSSPASTDC